MTTADRLAMIRAAHRRRVRVDRYARFVGHGHADDHDVPCQGAQALEIAPVTVAERTMWGVA